MIELAQKNLQTADAHHRYTYDKGIKKLKEDNGLVYLYKDQYGLLHASHWEDVAAGYGKYIITDEIEEDDGLPYVSGSVYTIFGAGEGFVYLTRNKDNSSKFHTKKTTVGNSTVVPRGKELKRQSCEILRRLYLMLDENYSEQKTAE